MERQSIALLDLIEHPVFALEPDSVGAPRYVAFNEHARRILGRCLSDVLGKTAVELYPGHLGEIAFRHHKMALLTGREERYELMLPFGSKERWIKTWLHPELDDSGKVVRLIGTSQDVTNDRIRADVQAEVGKLHRNMEETVSLAAHDLRTPLLNVGIIADLLRDGFQDLGDGKLQLIDLLEDVAQKAMSLVNNVLQVQDTPTSEPQSTDFELHTVIDEIRNTTDVPRNIEIMYSNCRLRANRDALSNVLVNLLYRARDVSSESQEVGSSLSPVGVHLSVSSRRRGALDFAFEQVTSNRGARPVEKLHDLVPEPKANAWFWGVKRFVTAEGGTMTLQDAPDAQGTHVCFSLPGSFLSSKLMADTGEPATG